MCQIGRKFLTFVLLSGLCLSLLWQPSAAAPSPSQIGAIKVWINAFIPKDVDPLTRTLPGTGPSSGKTAIPGPFYSDVLLNSCFLTDQRSFSDLRNAEQRMQSLADIDMTTPSLVAQTHRISPTIEANCQTGATLCNQTGSIADMTIQEIMTATHDDGSRAVRIRFLGTAHNPCFPHVPDNFVPDIDWDVTVDITVQSDRETGVASATGKVDGFPAFEMYISLGDEPGRPLFRIPPPVGNTPRDLQGPARIDLPLSTVTLDSNIQGQWESTDADHRFMLEISSTNVIWTERGTVNTTPGANLIRTVPLRSDSGKFRVERPNDNNDVLTFLSYKPQSLIDEILTHSPQASFIVFSRTGATLTAEWNGIVVRKNPNGTFRDIIQPGVRPSTPFTFRRVP